jgi:arginine N-succinyltransferase
MSLLFRPAHPDDLHAIHGLALQSGIGMTTLPKDVDLLNKRLQQSIASFHKTILRHAPLDEYYFFVLEDPAIKRIVGTAAIEALTGHITPFYSYRHTTSTKLCPSLHLKSTHDALILCYDNEGCSEVCTLYLEPSYRKNGNGLLLSLARFLFMANFPERFAPTVIADMRGVSDDAGHSPFWDAVGYPFFQMSFAQADQLTLNSNKQFIADLIPEHPIYLNLLPPAAQAVIGKTHPSTIPAMRMLVREGFQYHQTVDIFDAGPTLSIRLSDIRTLANSQLMRVHRTTQKTTAQRFILANTALDFRSTLTTGFLHSENQTCEISPAMADTLSLDDGDIVRISAI